MYRLKQRITILFLLFLAGPFALVKSQGKKPSPEPDFTELQTSAGKTYLNCFVTKIAADTLTVRHSKGMARISFFSLSKEIQNQYNFDPIAAVKKSNIEDKNRRDTKWKLFWEKQKHEATVANETAAKALYNEAKKSWHPIRAVILEFRDGGAYIRADRIVFVPTKKKSTLGFTVAGPPKMTIVPIKPDIIFIQNPYGKIAALKGRLWEGYMEPFSRGKIGNLSTGHISISVFRALPKVK